MRKREAIASYKKVFFGLCGKYGFDPFGRFDVGELVEKLTKEERKAFDQVSCPFATISGRWPLEEMPWRTR